jgi:hypothetical protein
MMQGRGGGDPLGGPSTGSSPTIVFLAIHSALSLQQLYNHLEHRRDDQANP